MHKFLIQDSKELCRVLAELKTPEEAMMFLEDICTIQEIEALSQRLDIARRLNDGMNYEEINRLTKVSSATISRVSKCLNYGSGGYNIALEILKGDGEN